MTPKPKRRWFQYSLRTLFVAIAVLGVWLAMVTSAARRQQSIVARLRELHAEITYDFEVDTQGTRKSAAVPPGPKWLRELVGQDYLSDVVQVNCSDRNIDDDDLDQLRGLKHLRDLNLIKTQITDAGLQHLSELKQLRSLSLSGPDITDTGLESLQGLDQLQCLSLELTSVTDVGLEHLKGLKQLQVLDLYGTKITDAGLKHLKGLTALRWLNVYHCTQLTEEGIKNLLISLPNLGLVPELTF